MTAGETAPIMKSKSERAIEMQRINGNYYPYRDAPDAPQWHTVTYNDEKMGTMIFMSMHQWLSAHTQDHYTSKSDRFYFKSPEDEFEFRLRWGDHLHT